MVKRKGLLAPHGFFSMSPEVKKLICNGAGPKGYGWAVPDTLYGLSVTKAANVHDFMYYWGVDDRKYCDKVFYKNMKAIIKEAGGKLRFLRKLRAYTYYKAVRLFGAAAYKEL